MHVLEMVKTVASSDSTVLLLGETGTGKELIARAIHDRSRRGERTFVKLNCAAIPTGLLESELFGHEKGAFTGAIAQKVGRMELADQGTLFLDEVGDIPIEIHFVQKFAKQMQKNVETIPATLMKGLTSWPWPGNIRELENFIERAVILTHGKSLEAPLTELRKPRRAKSPTQGDTSAHDIARIVKETMVLSPNGSAGGMTAEDREEIISALTECKGRVGGANGAAAKLGLNRTTLIARMKKFGITPQQYA
jgi:formate hydrogenlyase transcriptional activator